MASENVTCVLRERRLVEAFAERLDIRDAVKATGYSKPSIRAKLRKRDDMQNLLLEKMEAVSAESKLNALYVRQFIHDILELCPTDHFTLAPDGSYMIAPEQFSELDPRVKRLVEKVELKFVRGVPVYSIEFISKSSALSLAARYTLVQKVEAEVRAVPWDQLCGPAEPLTEDIVEERLQQEADLLPMLNRPSSE
jgi:hypothetical protein